MDARRHELVSQPPLIDFALKGLQHAWMPAKNRYAFSHRLDVMKGDDRENLSVPERDTFYTLNVLLGLAQLQPAARPAAIDIDGVYRDCCLELAAERDVPYAYGMALWAGAALDINPPSGLVDQMRHRLLTDAAIPAMTAQDVAMLASGVIAMALRDGAVWRNAADRLLSTIREQYFHPPTCLFYNQAKGLRRSFSSFASQVYAALALYQYGEAFGAGWAIDIARVSTAKIISLQGPQGEWGWFYYVPGGQVVDFYEVYSVHQYGMAPAFLHHAVAHGVSDARARLVKGFNWLFGDNQMGISMLCPEKHMFYRSQLRVGELNTTAFRGGRSLINAFFNRSDRPTQYRELQLRRECRSYEIGWILWSFASRSDYAEITQRAEFRV